MPVSMPTPTLDQWGRDLSKLARLGRLSEAIGREGEIEQIITILAILVAQSYGDWAVLGKLFSFEIAGKAWVIWFTEFSKWLTILLTALSGWLYLWNNREVFLTDV